MTCLSVRKKDEKAKMKQPLGRRLKNSFLSASNKMNVRMTNTIDSMKGWCLIEQEMRLVFV